MKFELPEKFTIYFILVAGFYLFIFFVSLFYLIIPCINIGLASNPEFFVYLAITFLPLPFLWYYLKTDFEEAWKFRLLTISVMLVCSLIIGINILPVILFWWAERNIDDLAMVYFLAGFYNNVIIRLLFTSEEYIGIDKIYFDWFLTMKRKLILLAN